MEGRFITQVHGLKISEVLAKGIELSYGMRLTNSISYIEGWFKDKQFILDIGELEADSLTNSTIVYSKSPLGDMFSPVATIDMLLKELAVDLFCLWLLRDNSIFTEVAFHRIAGRNINYGRTSSNILPVFVHKADGSRDVTTFSRSEILSAIEMSKIYAKVIRRPQDTGTNDNDLYSKGTRLERSLSFLISARTSTHLPIKIMHYCFALEALLSTQRVEVTAHLLTRVGQLLDHDAIESVRAAYKVRSYTIHGDSLFGKFSDAKVLASISVEIDEVLRKVLRKFLAERELLDLISIATKEEIDAWFIKEYGEVGTPIPRTSVRTTPMISSSIDSI